MPQSVFIQVGQCGNQIGFRFWKTIFKEYEAYKDSLNINELEYFLKPKSSSQTPEEGLTARGLLIDMEESVIKEGLRSDLKKLFTTKQILTDVSGSGNNWARGNNFFGKIYKDKIENIIRQEVEHCDKLDSFLFTFSMGGGTGSGLGTSILEDVETMYPSVKRLTYPVYPSRLDDVITSPYNALLANNKLSLFASLIVPFDNQALIEICSEIDKNRNKFHPKSKSSFKSTASSSSSSPENQSLPFSDMNDLISSFIADMTSCTRLPGQLNIDLSEIITNLTPYRSLKYGIPSSSPFILVPEDLKLERVFSDLFTPKHALCMCDINRSRPLSYAILARGNVTLMDVQNNINRCIKSLKLGGMDENLRKIGICKYPPANRHVSVVKITNSCEMLENLVLLKEKFKKMYQKKAHLHHYEDENVGDSEFNGALANLTDVIEKYRELKNSNVGLEPPRLNLV